MLLQEAYFKPRTYKQKVRGYEKIILANRKQKKVKIAILNQKKYFKIKTFTRDKRDTL